MGWLQYRVFMRWECHECGEVHQELPEQCRSCGTKPEIVENVWRCSRCGEQGIAGTRTSCPTCGAEKDQSAQLAVATGRRIAGEQGRALAMGSWLYCAFCKTQVPPVYTSGPKQGQPTERCPTCDGPLSESTHEAKSEVIRESEAATYRPQAVQRRGGGDAEPPSMQPPTQPSGAGGSPSSRRVWPWLLLLLLVGGLWLLFGPGKKVGYTVVGRSWERSIEIETLQKKASRDWQSDLPSGAYNTACQRKFRKNIDVPIGTETYFEDEEDRGHCEDWETRTVEEEVDDGKRCVEHGYKTQGGVSVKTCLSWEKKTKTVRKSQRECARYRMRHVKKTRTKYKQEPVYEPFCSYEVDTIWRTTRTLRSGGSDDSSQPTWPTVEGLSQRERAGKRQESYRLRLQLDKGKREEVFTARDEAEWQRHRVGSRGRAQVKLGSVVGLVDETP